MNVVVGPNGSGKSTILCAIALGLGSSANALERGDGVGCFVMRDKEKGWVEIELKGKRRATPTLSSAATWSGLVIGRRTSLMGRLPRRP